MSTCVQEACCVLYRGEVFLRKVGDPFYRSIGNSSQLRINHIEDTLELLSATATDNCCGIVGATVQLVMDCASEDNFLFASESDRELEYPKPARIVLVNPGVLPAGAFIPLEGAVEAGSVEVTGLPVGAYAIVPGGVKILVDSEPVDPLTGNPNLTIEHRTSGRSLNKVGLSCNEDYELLYVGVNVFNNAPVRLHIPRVRFRVLDSFDWIHDRDVGRLAVEGRIIFSGGVWYTLERDPESDGCTRLGVGDVQYFTNANQPLRVGQTFSAKVFVEGATSDSDITVTGLPTGVQRFPGGLPVGGVDVSFFGSPDVAGEPYEITLTTPMTCVPPGETTYSKVVLSGIVQPAL